MKMQRRPKSVKQLNVPIVVSSLLNGNDSKHFAVLGASKHIGIGKATAIRAHRIMLNMTISILKG